MNGLSVGQIVKVVDPSQFQHVVKIGQIMELRWWGYRLYAKVLNWGPWVPADQCIPLGRDKQ